MRITSIAFLLSILLSSVCLAQIPNVPSRMQLGDMKLTITDGAKKDIQKDINMLRASDKFFKIKLDRAALYMPIIERIFKEEGVPDEIKYLAIQESALISDVVSSSKAVGFWQFKDFTAREVGMRVDKKVDERKNIVSSTYGAARYFKNHQKSLDNWAHTVTAHMTGLGGIKKYTSPKDYGSKKMTITKKSHWYLKRFLAHKIAFEGALDHRHSEGLSIVEYQKAGGQDLGKVAQKFDVEKELLQHYNKWLIHGKVPNDKKYTVVVPVQKGNNRARNLARNESSRSRTRQPSAPKPLTRHQRTEEAPAAVVYYPSEIKPGLNGDQPEMLEINGVKAIVARQGDTFETLAKRSGLSTKKLLKFNELTTTPGSVYGGETYFVKKKKSKSRLGFHVVQEDETLWSISHYYGIRQDKLARMNRMSVIDKLETGRILWLAKKRPSSIPVDYQDATEVNEDDLIASEEDKDAPMDDPIQNQDSSLEDSREYPEGKFHEVKEGETLWAISRQYEVTVDELRRWNKISKYDPIKPGQKLALGKHKLPDPPKEKKPKRAVSKYVVQQGDTLYQIAKSHNMDVSELIELNNKKDSNIDIGEELKVYQ